MSGIDFVFHLARAHVQTWDDYLRHDVEPTRLIADACLEAGVKRLIYTGTITSYYTGSDAGTITEQTPLDQAIVRRDYYSRAKAAAESILMEMYRTKAAAGGHFSSRDRDRAIRNPVSLGGWHVDKRKFVPGMG